MAGIKFWSDMIRRTAANLRDDDKVMIGKQDLSDPQYSDLSDLREFLNVSTSRKDGYRWIRGEGNSGPDWAVGDEGIGVGTLFPGYVVHFYVKTAPIVDKNNDLVILSNSPL